MFNTRLLIALSLLVAFPIVAEAQIKIIPRSKRPTTTAPPQPKSKNIILTDQRTFRFDVKKLDPKVYVKVERHWSFEKSFPRGLLAAVRKHGKLKKLDPRLLRDENGKTSATGGYIRWGSAGKDRMDFGALLTFIDGPKGKLLGLRVDLLLDHKLGEGKGKPYSLKFDDLTVQVELEKGKLSNVKWGDRQLPGASGKPKQVTVEDSLEVDVMGSLTDKSSNGLRAADELFSGELLQKFQLLGLTDLKNISHHGITLGWLGHEDLRHRLSFLVGKPKAPVAFRYRISGDPFPIKAVRRQLQPTGWPMVLTGHRYVGSTANGVRVFRPVEFVLSRQGKKAGKAKP